MGLITVFVAFPSCTIASPFTVTIISESTFMPIPFNIELMTKRKTREQISHSVNKLVIIICALVSSEGFLKFHVCCARTLLSVSA